MSKINELILSEFRKSEEVNFLNWLENNGGIICEIEKSVLIAEGQNRPQNSTLAKDQEMDSLTIAENAPQPPLLKDPTGDLKQKNQEIRFN